MSWASRHQVTFTESTHCQKMERSTALFLPLLLLVVVFLQEGLGLKCWHTGKTTAVSLIILEATKIPFWLRPAQNSQNPYHLKIPQIQLQGYALVTSERSAQVRWIYNFLFEIQLFTKRRKQDFCSEKCSYWLVRYRSWRKVVTWPKCSVSEKPILSAQHQTSTSGKIVILIMTM